MKLFLISVIFAASSLAHAGSEIICHHEGFSDLTISLRTGQAQMLLSVLQSGKDDGFSPRQGETAVLKLDKIASQGAWNILRSESSSSGRNMEISLPKLAQDGQFRGAFRSSDTIRTSVLTSFDLLCKIK